MHQVVSYLEPLRLSTKQADPHSETPKLSPISLLSELTVYITSLPPPDCSPASSTFEPFEYHILRSSSSLSHSQSTCLPTVPHNYLLAQARHQVVLFLLCPSRASLSHHHQISHCIRSIFNTRYTSSCDSDFQPSQFGDRLVSLLQTANNLDPVSHEHTKHTYMQS